MGAASTSDRPVLITGCSSGIGRESALSLHAAGRTVVATARRPESIADLADAGIRTARLDVTDESSMTETVSAIEGAAGPIDVLINNAGYGLYGPVEQVPMEQVREQFETNFFGLVRLIQLVVPGMRRARRGRIVNVSSMGGRTTLPGGAFYHASKHAVEALSDALRMELRQFGIDVILIEPGPVNTAWNDVAAASLPETGTDADPYADYKAAVTTSFATATTGPLARLGSSAADIGAVITKAVTSPRPRTRYLINPIAKVAVAAKTMLPDRVHDAALRRQYGLPG
jgi:NAD(P)-dependent dehydrogenase (short-subunit alcohol dehydrogenase family)